MMRRNKQEFFRRWKEADSMPRTSDKKKKIEENLRKSSSGKKLQSSRHDETDNDGEPLLLAKAPAAGGGADLEALNSQVEQLRRELDAEKSKNKKTAGARGSGTKDCPCFVHTERHDPLA